MRGGFFETWIAFNSRVDEQGRPICSLVDPDTGRTRAVAFIACGGGGPDSYTSAGLVAPPVDLTNRREVLANPEVIVVRNRRGTPVVIGTLPHAQSEMERDEEDADSDRDTELRITPRDFAALRAGRGLVIDRSGRVTIDTALARIQLGADGVLRVSQAGQANEQVVMGVALYDFLSDLVDTVNRISTNLLGAGNIANEGAVTHAHVPVVVPPESELLCDAIRIPSNDFDDEAD